MYVAVNVCVQTFALAGTNLYTSRSHPQPVALRAMIVHYYVLFCYPKIAKQLSTRRHNNNITTAATKHSLIQENCSGFMYLNTRAGRGDRKGNERDIETNRTETKGEGMKAKERETHIHTQEEALKLSENS